MSLRSCKRDDWPLENPKGKPIQKDRESRNEIRDRVLALINGESWSQKRDLIGGV
jgi:arsenate reductase